MDFKIPYSAQEKIKEKLNFIYGKEKTAAFYPVLEDFILEFAAEHPELRKRDQDSARLSEKDSVVICYGDHIQSEGDPPLQTLNEFFKNHLEESISTIHLLPFFPYSSDDGFAVIDYKEVNPDFGDWSDIEALRANFSLMFDAVVNHISAESKWFEKYKKQEGKYANYFIEADPEKDYSEVTRPRAKPLLTEVETAAGKKHVWTTFSPDQIDLNFKETEVLLEIIDVLLFYAAQGAEIIRLDAIAYLWKEIGTSCIHLPETHKVIQLFKEIFKLVAPETLILTETNVPHEENISYFGEGVDEADMVYNFTLPPLVLYSFLEEDASKLTEWAASLEELEAGNYYFNFLASHDGVGLRPVEGILNENQIEDVVKKVKAKGGLVSYKTNSDGSKSPYEINVSYVDAVRDQENEIELQVKQFMASQAIMLALQGVPGIYLHSLLGSENYQQGVEESGENRRINREKLDRDRLLSELKEQGSFREQVFNSYRQLLKLRKENEAFAPESPQNILELERRVFAVQRGEGDQKITALINVSDRPIQLEIKTDLIKAGNGSVLRDIITEEDYKIENNSLKVKLKPYQNRWLKARR
ncbi:sucrose phosphorylase [Halanaerobium saccharolyticum]|uniref:Sucrose 6(F)-phosphate phosphorylase n=1 Tax=Halanaerobium saccharolyticum TaxID=43595 RepID=A0A4R7ZAF5_9FIRM|nr:sugar phosphorylase [Halanaerobium saccharolyticum]RAK12685.1 sucrose phosphorylase [Halanaerobium saccharolyticum]TDW05403.1 sucrose phosphorylase [Halanaerobium saccharolyticum]TDX62918.1 sucrose phosphorylase [Halanaerobium saccharolyticum]